MTKKENAPVLKCFCGKQATHHVFIPGYGGGSHNRFGDGPRCEEHTDRARRSYDDVVITPLESAEGNVDGS